jgi:hypothetical protein
MSEKRPPSVWASLVSAHIKAGGKFPRKGTEDYDKLKKQLDSHKASKSSAPAAPAVAAPKPRGRPKKQLSGVPMPATDAPIANEIAALPVAKKPRTRKVAASKPAVTKDDEIMEAPAEVAIQAKEKMNRKAKTSTMVAADNLPKVKKSVRAPDLVKDVSEKKGMASTIPLARISGTTGIKIPFTDRLMPSVNPV